MRNPETNACAVETKKELHSVLDECGAACIEISSWLSQLEEARERLMGTQPAKVTAAGPDNQTEAVQPPFTVQMHRLRDQLVQLSDKLHREVDYISSVI